MKKNNKCFIRVFVMITAVFCLAITGCPGDSEIKKIFVEPEPPEWGATVVTVTFAPGYAGAPEIAPVKILKGTVADYLWPGDPKRDAYVFKGWFKGADKYTAQTIINDTITVTAHWALEISIEDQPGSAEVAALFTAANGFPAQLSDTWKIWGHKNSLLTHGFGADPTALVYEDKVYIYASNDSLMYNASGSVIQMDYAAGIQGTRSLSSADLVNWTDHGVINITGVRSTNPLIQNTTALIAPYKYASAAWAPSATWKMLGGSPKFFVFYANSGNGIGVISADSPIGPWSSPIDRLLIDRDTPNCGSVSWLFDPGVFVDDDGQGYLYLGGGDPQNVENTGQARRVKLGHDMISLAGIPETWNMPYLFEASELTKIKGKYYASWVTNSASKSGNLSGSYQIAYMIGDNPMGPYPASGGSGFGAPRPILNAPSSQLGTSDENNHHDFFEFKDRLYITYHASTITRAMGLGTIRYRSPHIDEVAALASIPSDGILPQVAMTRIGVDQVGRFNPYVLNEAESIGNQGGIYTRAVEDAGNGMVVTAIDSGDWVGVYGVDFGSAGAAKFTARVRTPETPENYVGAIEIRLDPARQGITSDTANLDGSSSRAWISGGEVIGRIRIKAKEGEAGNFSIVSINLDKTVTGVHDLVFVFYSSLGAKPITTGTSGNFQASHHKNGFEFDQWQFFN